MPPADWTYSPVPEVDDAVGRIRRKYPVSFLPGLDPILLLLEKLGNPHRRLPFVFHVAGTNGKGSSLAFLQAVFEAAGLRVHKYVSPHLVRFEERIIIAGKEIDPQTLLELIGECARAAGDDPVSFFEFFTAVSFLAHTRHPADALLLETGLGGLYDATNVVGGDRLMSLLTRISYDHTGILGPTLREIAVNKAGIIKPRRPCVIAHQTSPDVIDVFLRRAEAAGAPVALYGRDWETVAESGGFEYKSRKNRFRLPPPRLPGRHQVCNAGAALAALENSPYASLLQQKILERAMSGVFWPGRLEHVTAGPLAGLLPEGWELWLDGAHNDSGAEVLADQAEVWGTDKPLHLVTAMKNTKDAAGFYHPLLAHAATVQAMEADWTDAQMASAEDICGQIRQMGYDLVKTSPNLESALRSLVFQFPTPQRILVTGSLYLVGRVLREQY
ncbi:MAG: Mur ligase family protein [Pseudomonadota bacterium]